MSQTIQKEAEEAHTKFETCEQQGHHLNKVECWVNGTHSSGTIQCGVCGTKLKYDYTFPVDPSFNLVKVYKVKSNGYWRKVNYDELVFTFEEDEEEQNIQSAVSIESTKPNKPVKTRKPTFFEKIKDKFKR